MNDACRMECRKEARPSHAPTKEASSSFCIPHSSLFIPRARAFTLLELVLVMVIISIVLAMVAPSLSGFSAGRDADFAAAQLVSVGRWAREQAISEGRVYRLNFDESSQTYFVTAQVGGTFVRPEVEFGQLFEVPEGVVMAWTAPREGGVAVIDFFPSGRCQPALVTAVARDGQETRIASLSPTEPLRVLEPGEAVPG